MNLSGPVLALPDRALDRQYRIMHTSGVRQVRIPVNWALIQPEPNAQPDLGWLDRALRLGAKYKIDSLPVVYGSPAWAAAPVSDCNRCSADLEISATQPRDPDEFALFVSALVKKYGPGGSLWPANSRGARPVRSWQVWNEPDLPSYWQSDSWAEGYGRLLSRTRDAIRSVDPGAKIVLAGLTNRSFNALSELLGRGSVRGRFDVVAVNLFTRKPSDQKIVLGRIRSVLDSAGETKLPVWITEWTWLTGAKNPSWNFPPVVPGPLIRSTTEASFVGMRQSQNNGVRLNRAYWYTWASNYAGEYPFDYSGLNVLRTDGSIVPSMALRAWRAGLAKASKR